MSSIIKRVVKALLICTAFAGFVFGTSTFVQDLGKKVPTDSEVMREFNMIKIPQGDVQIDQPQVINKTGLTIISSHYKSSKQIQALTDYYGNELRRLGYKLRDSSINSAGEGTQSFDRRGYHVDLQFRQDGDHGHVYYLGIRTN